MILSELAKKYDIDFSEEKIHSAIDEILKITHRNIIKFQGAFPKRVTINGIYGYEEDVIGHDLWWRGFWGGINWLAYEYTGDYRIRCYGERITESVHRRIKKSGMHHNDIGMLVILTCMANYKVCKNKLYKETIVEAADSLLTRYTQNHHILSSFDFERGNNVLTLKITGMLNVLMLRYAYNFTGNAKYKEAFQRTVDMVIKHNIMPDGKTVFNTYFDKLSGEFIQTKVPYVVWEDDGKRTRNYSWVLYALAIMYSITKDKYYAEIYDKVFEYMLSLCKDDSIFYGTFSKSGPLDTISPSILAGALLEMLRHDEIKENRKYAKMAAYLINTLIDRHAVRSSDRCEGLLYGAHLFGVTTSSNQSALLGDYFYFEALMNSICDRKSYWYTVE